MASAGLARLHGLFAVYKPPGLKWKHLRDTVELQLLKGLNAEKPPAPEQHVRFLPGPMEGSEKKELTLTVTSVPTLVDHPLVRGPVFTSLKVGVGHRLDAQASGVLVLGMGHGRKLLTDMYNAHLTKEYTVRGLLGKATDDFCEDGRLVEKTTYDHVTREKLDRILALIQGSHQKALVMYSNLDLQTQEAYEMAVSGLIRPMNKSPMLITGIRCLQFAPPEFLLEVQCMHETQKQLRRLVHEIGLELKSTAVCSQVRRTRDGFFTLDDALLRTQWDLPSIQGAIQAAAPRVAAELEKSLRPGPGTQLLPGPGRPWDSEEPNSALGQEGQVRH
ncbi:mitochondrial mRNA pseudouridine synthase TRUB2 [Camelus ferus]|uniref:Mitochondrial mRNA pseudouridine synthase TRUB2 n=2 Tax=Camelus TaxID=9836 RepID=A0A9W3EJQ6_CAMBA|nr:mitochondrial mRNA pseudouridine synthase TRUB2 [Camelus ferus]XP_010949488.1 mitochondrial mRNA pseudouridine synthase TRUB2 [Camelus bactrianus]XP_045369820.1 mitochondrial mRNA pseudouridine synthase TRUB2 [Camelus bactrianus]